MKIKEFILCIGEEDDDCTFMSQAISGLKSSIKVQYQYTGSSAIAFLIKTSANGLTLLQLIVIDLDMPAMDGKETLNSIRKIPALNSIPIMFLSNNPEELDEHFLETYHVTILKKPFTMDGYKKIAETIIYSLL